MFNTNFEFNENIINQFFKLIYLVFQVSEKYKEFDIYQDLRR